MGGAREAIDDMHAGIFKALGHPTRLRIVRYLEDGEHTVSEIVRAVSAEQSNVSRHLALLKEAGILRSRKEGLRVFYGLSLPCIGDALNVVLLCVQRVVRQRLRRHESVFDEVDDTKTPLAGDAGGE